MTFAEIKELILTEDETATLIAANTASMIAALSDKTMLGEAKLIASAMTKILKLNKALEEEMKEREGDNYGK